MKTCLRCTRMKNVNKGGGADPQPKFNDINEEKCGDKTGRIKFYDEVKGFGFIIPDDKPDDILFYSSGLTNLNPDDIENLFDRRVCYTETSDKNERPIATNIRIIK